MGNARGDAQRYAYLMQFTDGTRIDLTFRPVSDVSAVVADSLSLVLLDKEIVSRRRHKCPQLSADAAHSEAVRGLQ